MDSNPIIGIALITYGGLVLLDLLVRLPFALRLPLFFIGAAGRRLAPVRFVAAIMGAAFIVAGILMLAG